MSWRFYPLQEHVHIGLLHKPGKGTVPAQFHSPEEARAIAQSDRKVKA